MVTRQPGGAFRCGNLLSKSAKMREVFDLIADFGGTDVPVLIEGESGTGKQVVARAIHQASAARRAGPLVVMNCAAVPETLLEIELFGHVRGVFSPPGGRAFRPGALENARGGTLFLGYIESASPRAQGRLGLALRRRLLVRVGDTQEVEVDVRVIASMPTAEQLGNDETAYLDMRSWADALRLRIPPLRERPKDVPLLAEQFAQQFSPPGQPPAELSPPALNALMRHQWPGNVRELRNVIERACILSQGGTIRPEHLP
jgi:DNA-binding NtrC family response regulator